MFSEILQRFMEQRPVPVMVQALLEQVLSPHKLDAWFAQLAKVVYVDRYGNLLTGLRADRVSRDQRISVGGRWISFARTFCEVPQGAAFWYQNAFGLVELAVNQGRADQVLGLALGDGVEIFVSGGLRNEHRAPDTADPAG